MTFPKRKLFLQPEHAMRPLFLRSTALQTFLAAKHFGNSTIASWRPGDGVNMTIKRATENQEM